MSSISWATQNKNSRILFPPFYDGLKNKRFTIVN
jgi:hypothetical protein